MESLTDIKAGHFKSVVEAQNYRYSLDPDSFLWHQELANFLAIAKFKSKGNSSTLCNFFLKNELNIPIISVIQG